MGHVSNTKQCKGRQANSGVASRHGNMQTDPSLQTYSHNPMLLLAFFNTQNRISLSFQLQVFPIIYPNVDYCICLQRDNSHKKNTENNVLLVARFQDQIVEDLDYVSHIMNVITTNCISS